VKFIKKNYMNQISQEDAANAGNVSTTYLSRLFKEEMKIGFNEYLNQVRIEESKRLLAETNYSIKEIAMMTGYADEKYFSKLFKKSIGIKPTEYRRLYG
jgi:two-component system response regulator YesN